MPGETGSFQDVVLQPGVNAQLTLAQNQAGVSVANLVRYKGGQVQKIGGWTPYFPNPVSSTPVRDIEVWRSLRNTSPYVATASPSQLSVINNGALVNITPQGFESNVTPSFSVTAGSNVITINDPGSSMSTNGAVRFDTPVAVAGLLLSGGYPINTVIDQNNYTILAPSNSSATVASSGILPSFYTLSGSGNVGVLLPNNGVKQVIGLFYPFTASTTVGGLTIQGSYQVTSISDSTNFFIGSSVPATSTVSSASAVPMNGGLAAIFHWTGAAPLGTGAPYGSSNYGTGMYGLGVVGPAPGGTPITATDWTLDNWGQDLIACQENGAIYVWAPDLNLQQAQPVTQGGAPLYNIGAFVSQPQQILFAWGSCQVTTGSQNPLIIRWSDIGSQQGFNQWVPAPANFAGSFQINSGSTLRAAAQTGVAAVFLTDIDAWVAQYVGQPIVWGFTRVGTGCGCIGKHAITVQSGVVYWAGLTNFYMYGPNGVSVVPCSVWDFFFQQLDFTNMGKVRAASNAEFNEIAFYFPVKGGNGENSAYVKVHIDEMTGGYEWDYGFLTRTAWTDVSLAGGPLGTDTVSFLYQHEGVPDGASTAINGYIETGYFELGDGTQLVIVDWVLPDMKWNVVGGTSGTILYTFFTTDYPGQPERVYGPYAVTVQNPWINTRMRGRYWRCRIESQDLGSFWRVGRIKFRWKVAGRR